jgi:glucose/mannose transport system substrate-binding protein
VARGVFVRALSLGLFVSSSLIGSWASAAPAARPRGESTLLLYHWWISPSESAAFESLTNVFHRYYPEVRVSPVLVKGAGSTIFPVVTALSHANEPPDAFQMNAGYASQIFVEAGLVSPIDELWASEGLEQVVPRLVRDLNRINGHYYSVPVNIHRMNVIWYNKAVLEKYGVDPSTLTTWDAFLAAAARLRKGGMASPIQIGPLWTATHAFECILASQGIGTYQDFVNGKITAAEDPRLLEAFSLFGKYLDYVNGDWSKVSWDTAVTRVVRGEAAFCAMGDWANGDFRLAGAKYRKDYGALIVPGTNGMFGVTVDTFMHPKGLKDETNSSRWLKIVASREGQDAFNAVKGSVSARIDADPTRYDAYQRSALVDLKSAKYLYPTLAVGAPESFNGRLNEIVLAFLTDRDVKKAARAVAAATGATAAKFTRVWSLR